MGLEHEDLTARSSGSRATGCVGVCDRAEGAADARHKEITGIISFIATHRGLGLQKSSCVRTPRASRHYFVHELDLLRKKW